MLMLIDLPSRGSLSSPVTKAAWAREATDAERRRWVYESGSRWVHDIGYTMPYNDGYHGI